MDLQKYFAVIFIMCCMQFFEINGYPTLNIRRLFDSSVDSRYKKSDFSLPQADDDVIELEHLKHSHIDGVIDNISEQLKEHHQQQLEQDDSEMPIPIAVAETDSVKHYHLENIPELERQLELATASSATPTAVTVKPPVDSTPSHSEQEHAIQGAHRPPMLPLNDGGKTSSSNQQQADVIAGGDTNLAGGVPSMAKPFYGAARLAFGQNPEVLPTSSTTSTSTALVTSTTTTTTSSAGISDVADTGESISESSNKTADETAAAEATATSATPTTIGGQMPSHPIHPPNSELNVENKNEQNKESVGDVNMDELEATKSASRRSVPYLMTPKTAENLLRHRDGQYSPFDMAQYVFWTGDEAGVARAVEELIEQGLMTRENALKFLRDIRVCIEYLQRSYSNRVLPQEINNVKKSFLTPTTTSTTTTTTTTTEKPFPHVRLETDEGGRRNLHFQKALDSISMWNKLQEINNEGRQELTDYDEAAGRAKIAEFLHTEYTLEEILYNLAKVMFTQSLAHGSDEAQQELQKLTDFLEREGNRGVIPLDLQKKVLHVLLTALSDTLNERPELLTVARLNLGNTFNTLPVRSYGALK